jgi:dihydrofolate reductase
MDDDFDTPNRLSRRCTNCAAGESLRSAELSGLLKALGGTLGFLQARSGGFPPGRGERGRGCGFGALANATREAGIEYALPTGIRKGVEGRRHRARGQARRKDGVAPQVKVRVHTFGMSLDGFSAGASQDLQHPLGVRGEEMMQWFFPTRMFRKTGPPPRRAARPASTTRRRSEGFENLGAWILGRNMFGPVRGPWPDESWKGWWGEEPPYHVPVFVLTHHARKPLEMKGGTVFHFVTDGIESALAQAKSAAKGRTFASGVVSRRCANTSRHGSSTRCTLP